MENAGKMRWKTVLDCPDVFVCNGNTYSVHEYTLLVHVTCMQDKKSHI